MAADVSLTIAFFNVNGLSQYEKMKDIFDYLRKKNLDIVMLQETHIKSESENYIRSIWGYNCFICGNSTASKGTAILFKNTFSYTVHNVIKDTIGGSYLIIDVSIFDERYLIANVYGPSDSDRPEFFDNFFRIIENLGGRQVVIGGDFNVLLNPDMDARNYRSLNLRPRSRQVIKDKIENLDLTDIYRNVYPDRKIYTWRRFNSLQQGRLDYLLISDNMIDKVVNVDILPGYRSDHSIVNVSLKHQQIQEKIRGYWKFNNSLLKDKTYISEIKNIILDTKKQYALPVYDHTNISTIPNNELEFSVNDQLFFESLLLEIRGKTISYASYKKRKDEAEERKLIKEIEELETKLNLDQEKMIRLEENKLALQEIRENKLRGAIIRSRINWLQNGEKPSRYFTNLENRNFRAKRMLFLEQENGNIIYDQNELLEETKTFYENLYDKKDVNIIDLDVLVNHQKKII